MRPALQRLLSRPSSLDLLQCLVGTPTPLSAPAAGRHYRRTNIAQSYASIAAVAQQENVYDSQERIKKRNDSSARNPRGPLKTYTRSRKLVTAHTVPTETSKTNEILTPDYFESRTTPIIWGGDDEIDFQSNLAAPEDPSRQRLIDLPKHENDVRLFARLLDDRERRYGMEGIRMYWEAVKKRRIILPTRDETKDMELTAGKLWTSFLTLGFRDNKVLEEVCSYADNLLETKGHRWSRLYSTIVQHFLTKDQGAEALVWHDRLFERHPPTAKAFAELCHQTVHNRGDLQSLEEIYDMNEHRNAYGKIVPTLAWQEDFKSALRWHFKLIRKGDVPTKPQHARRLSHFLAIYHPKMAVQVTQSLVAAGAAFDMPKLLNDSIKISREMMNLVHSTTFKIPVKTYNDEYGARWFATTWVPLDLAMHSIHALGIQEIGPLSLQALCVRKERDGLEPAPQTIVHRIEQLEDLGISIGNSVFSRAVKHFAQSRMFNYLKGLLKSDQHPDSYEDRKHLEDLLASFARIRDWEQYRRILAIRMISSEAPSTEAQNVWLKTHVANNNLHAALDVLAKMQVSGTIVKASTISYIVRHILVDRQRSHRPRTIEGGSDDIHVAINVLKGAMNAGNVVPPIAWREVIRRLGMMGHQRDLRELCMFLAARYGPDDKSYLQNTEVRKKNLYRIPAQIRSSHLLHPLRMLFPASLQRSIVEWGFINAFLGLIKNQWALKDLFESDDIDRQVTSGITLLRNLGRLGVHVDKKAIKKAIINRLIAYYGPGYSNRPINRASRVYGPDLVLMIRQVNKALGKEVFGLGSGLKQLIASRGLSRLRLRNRKEESQRLKRLRSLVISNTRALQ